MNTIFKSALNQIKAEDELVNKTEIYLKENLTNNNKTKLFTNSKTLKRLIAAACFLLVLAGGGKAAYAYYWTPVAYLSLDINPSVELGINAFDQVVSAEGYNEDGQTILEGTNITGTNITDAVQTLVQSADSKGFILDDGSTVISLTSETDDTDKADGIQTDSESGVIKALEKLNKSAAVRKDNVALERRDEAKELGVTPGKLNLINKLQEVDPTATVEDYKDVSVKEIMKDIQANTINGKSSEHSQKQAGTISEDATLQDDEQSTESETKSLNKTDKANTKSTNKVETTTAVTTEGTSETSIESSTTATLQNQIKAKEKEDVKDSAKDNNGVNGNEANTNNGKGKQ